jgi:regulator of protease activity HflC (stomatin/prohibitin superfamily)
VMRVYQNVPDYRVKLQSLAFERFKREMGKVNVQDFAQHRGLVANNTLQTLKADANRLYGIELIDFQITDVTYTKTYREAVEASATAKQAVQQAEQEKAHAQVVAETQKIQAEGKANAVIAAAKGDAAATLLNADAQAKQIRLKGEAEATAIRAQAEALRSNASLIELRKFERWDGKLPASVGVGSAIPFIDVGEGRGARK